MTNVKKISPRSTILIIVGLSLGLWVGIIMLLVGL